MKITFENFFKSLKENSKKYKKIILIATVLGLIGYLLSMIQLLFMGDEIVSFIISLISLVVSMGTMVFLVYMGIKENVKVLLEESDYNNNKIISVTLWTLLLYIVLFVTFVVILLISMYFIAIPIIGILIFVVLLILMIVALIFTVPLVNYAVMRQYLDPSKNIFIHVSENFSSVFKRTYGAILAAILSYFVVVIIAMYPIYLTMIILIGSDSFIIKLFIILIAMVMYAIMLCISNTIRYNLMSLMMSCAITDSEEVIAIDSDDETTKEILISEKEEETQQEEKEEETQQEEKEEETQQEEKEEEKQEEKE